MSMDAADQDTEPRRRGGPLQFWREVQAESKKVTWATRNEVTVSTIMVLMMAVAAGVFFFVVDMIMHFGVGALLNLGGGGGGNT